MPIRSYLVALATLTVCVSLAADDVKGAATPHDLMRAVGAAFAASDREALVRQIDTVAMPEGFAEQLAAAMVAGHAHRTIATAAAKKHGDAAGAQVTQAAKPLEMMLLDTQALAETGVLEKREGGKARLTSAKPVAGGDRSVPIIEREGRWYLDVSAPSDPADLERARAVIAKTTEAATAFNRTVTDLLASDADAVAFGAGVEVAGTALSAAVKSAMPPVEPPAIGGPDGDPVSADRLRGARLSYIKRGLVWTFDAETVTIVADPGPLPQDLVERLLGKAAAVTRITAKWRCDGRTLELTDLASGEIASPGPVKLAIATAGPIRVNLGDGRQYNVFEKK